VILKQHLAESGFEALGIYTVEDITFNQIWIKSNLKILYKLLFGELFE
jgi:hypothetical protein